ncbi:MAG TPA: hypothetical protein VJG90_09195 [Candidatus Nanoarchaeia archaeon]|nr:hypothetical protein [Candidatus Nanoarchaeia archaeon]
MQSLDLGQRVSVEVDVYVIEGGNKSSGSITTLGYEVRQVTPRGSFTEPGHQHDFYRMLAFGEPSEKDLRTLDFNNWVGQLGDQLRSSNGRVQVRFLGVEKGPMLLYDSAQNGVLRLERSIQEMEEEILFSE